MTNFSLLGRSNLVRVSAIAMVGTALGCSNGGTTTSTGAGGGNATSSASTGTGSGSTTSTSTSTGAGGMPSTGPITAPDNTWTFIDFPDSRCMTDTPTGIGVNLNSASKDVIIYLEGGNACFNDLSCNITYNKNGYDATNFKADATGILSNTSLFQRTAGNPLKDYNYIFVPYCTGDVHAGDVSGVMVGGQTRNFHGFKNMTSYLKRITATFPNPGKVILAGSSAGGFGAALNYDQTAKAFGSNVKVTLIDDSGPPMAEMYVPACLQKYFVDTWRLDKNVPAGCADCAQASGVFMEPITHYLATTYPDRYLAIISGTQDGTISKFWGYGDNSCADINPPGSGFPGPYLGTEYAAGLADVRDRITKGDSNFYTYYVDGTNGSDPTRHVWLDNPSGVTSNGVMLIDWLTKLVANDPTLVDVPPHL